MRTYFSDPGLNSPSRETRRYVGRFAPTPSGPLHFGSIVAALGSFIDARAHNGVWLLRIDDLDIPRIRPGAITSIQKALERLGLYWDSELLFQSERQDAYQEALDNLQNQQLLYPCYCPRRLTRDIPYPGTCHGLPADESRQHCIRIRVSEPEIILKDILQGPYSQNIMQETGDFIIRRADKIFAYHLAVVVDDAYQDVNTIVRGADLLPSCPPQIYLQKKLHIETPAYLHLPVVLNEAGQKVSKTEGADDILHLMEPREILIKCLQFLGQIQGNNVTDGNVDEILQWAVSNWKRELIPHHASYVKIS